MEFKVTFANGRQTYVDADNEKELKSELDELVKTFGSDVSKVSAMDEKFSLGGFLTGSLLGAYFGNEVAKNGLQKTAKKTAKSVVSTSKRTFNKAKKEVAGFKKASTRKYATGGITKQADGTYHHSSGFKIEPYDKGRYILIDPDGMDAVGESMTLSEAKQTLLDNVESGYFKRGGKAEPKYGKLNSNQIKDLKDYGYITIEGTIYYDWGIATSQNQFAQLEKKAYDQIDREIEKKISEANKNREVTSEEVFDFKKRYVHRWWAKVGRAYYLLINFGKSKYMAGGKTAKGEKVYQLPDEDYSYTNSFGIDQSDFEKMVDTYHNTNPLRQVSRIEQQLFWRRMAEKYGEEKTDEVGNYIHETHESHQSGAKYGKGGAINSINDIDPYKFEYQKWGKGKLVLQVFFDKQGTIKYVFDGDGKFLKEFSMDGGKTKIVYTKGSYQKQYGTGGGVGKYEYKTINTRSASGLKEAERLKAEGWKIISTGFDTIQFERLKKNTMTKKHSRGGLTGSSSKVEFLSEEFASEELINELKEKTGITGNSTGDVPVIAFAFTDYGGDFIDKVAIEYFEENYPENIVSENTSYFGKNAFVFGEPAERWIEETEDYPLGFDDFESYYYDKQYEAEVDGFNSFLDDLSSDYEFDRDRVMDYLLEEKGGYYSITTQGLDYSSSDLIEELENAGEITKKEFGKGGYIGGLKEAEVLAKTIVYDNNGESFDRYTIFTPDGSVYGMSENASGFNQYIGDDTEIEKGSHLGKKLKSVPSGIKKAVLNRMENEEYKSGGTTEKNYEVELFFKGLSGQDRKVGKYVISEKSLDRLEEEYGHVFSIDVLDETSKKATSYYDLKKEIWQKGRDKGLYADGGGVPKANLGMLLLANQMMQNRQQRLSDPNYRSRWEDRGLDYRGQQPMMYPQQPMQQPMQPMGQPMYARGGSVGSEITFNHWDGTKKTGTIVEIFPDGSMDVSCGFGHCLVNPSDVVGAEKMARGSKVSGKQKYVLLFITNDDHSIAEWFEIPESKFTYELKELIFSKGYGFSDYYESDGEYKFDHIDQTKKLKKFLSTEKMARGSKVSEYYGIKESNVITEKQVNLIKNRLNAGKKDAELEDIVQYIWDNAPDLTPDQNKKGHEFLMSLWKSPTGKERVNNPFGYREQEALEQFDHFSLAGFHDASRYGQAPYYIPLYDVWMKDGEYGFQYYYNGEVSIVGAKGMKVSAKSEISHYKVRGEIFVDYMDAMDYCDRKNISYDEIVKTKSYGNGGRTNDRNHVNKSQDYEVRYARSHSGRSGYKNNQEYGVGGGVRTNSKEVREKVRQHILDSVYDYEENKFDNFQDASQHLTDEFKRVADHPYNLKRFPNNQKRFQDYLQGIPFNFEFEDYKIEEFLNSLGINPTGKEYSSDQMWHLYSYLIWREVEPTYRSSKFGGGGTTSDYTLDQDIEFTTTEEDDYLSGNVGGDALDLIDVTHVGNNTNGSAYYTATARSYSVAFEDISGQELEDELFNTINEMFSKNDQIDVDLKSVRLKYGKGGSTAGWKRDRMFVDKGAKHEVRYARSHAGRSGYKGVKYGTGGSTGSKVFNEMFGIGSSKYVVNYHDGKKTHNDGSPFFDIAIFKNKIEKDRFINKLRADGYKEKSSYGTGGTTGSKFYVVDNRELTFGSSKPVVASFDTREEARADAKDRNKIYDADTKMFSVMTAKQLKAEGVTEFGKGGSAGKSKAILDAEKELRQAKKSKISSWIDEASRKLDLAYAKDDNKYGKGGSAGNPKGFKSSNLYYNGHGVDANGNKVIRVSFPNSRAFSIQTNGNLPKTHAMSKGGYDEKEINQYVKEYGSDAQKKKLKIY